MYQVLRRSFLNEQSVTLSPLRTKSERAFVCPVSDESSRETGRSDGAVSSVPSNLTKDLNYKKTRKPLIFGSRQRNALRRSGACCDEFDPEPSHWIFLTGTLPSVLKVSFDAIARNSGIIVNKLSRWIDYSIDSEMYFFYCWERQKRGALHLHYCVRVVDKDKANAIINKFKSWWIKCLRSIEKKESVPMFIGRRGIDHYRDQSNVQADAQRVVKSVSRYIAKYVSKKQSQSETRWSHGKTPPRRWWGCSSAVRRLRVLLTVEDRYVYPGYRSAKNRFDRLVLSAQHFAEGCGQSFQLSTCVGLHFSIFGEDKWIAVQKMCGRLLMNQLSPSRKNQSGSQSDSLTYGRRQLLIERLGLVTLKLESLMPASLLKQVRQSEFCLGTCRLQESQLTLLRVTMGSCLKRLNALRLNLLYDCQGTDCQKRRLLQSPKLLADCWVPVLLRELRLQSLKPMELEALIVNFCEEALTVVDSCTKIG